MTVSNSDSAMTHVQSDLARQILCLSAEEPLEVVEYGWTSRVFLARGGRLVCKFPRNEAIKAELRTEVECLKRLASEELLVSIPRLIEAHSEFDFVAYRGVVGRHLCLDDLSGATTAASAVCESVASCLAQFISIIRTLPARLESGLTLEAEISETLHKFDLGTDYLSEHLSPGQFRDLVRCVRQDYPRELRRLGYVAQSSHGDLGFWNLLFNPEDGSVGVIDFGDFGRYDESLDFVGLAHAGLSGQVLDRLGASECVRLKVDWRRRLLPVLELPYYLGKRDKAGIEASLDKIKHIA